MEALLMGKISSNCAYFESPSNSAPFLLSGMCIPNFYKPLIFSRQSHSQESATQRCSLNLVSKVWQVLGHGGPGVLVVLVRLLGGGVPLLLHDTKGQCPSQVHCSKGVSEVINHLRFIAGKVRPLGLEGLGAKVREVFKESEVSLFQFW